MKCKRLLEKRAGRRTTPSQRCDVTSWAGKTCGARGVSPFARFFRTELQRADRYRLTNYPHDSPFVHGRPSGYALKLSASQQLAEPSVFLTILGVQACYQWSR